MSLYRNSAAIALWLIPAVIGIVALGVVTSEIGEAPEELEEGHEARFTTPTMTITSVTVSSGGTTSTAAVVLTYTSS